MTDLERLLVALRGSQIIRMCLVGVLTVVLLIPIAMIGGLVSERQSKYREAVEEVSASWGNLWVANNLHRASPTDLIARRLDERPCKTLEFETPAERFNAFVASTG